jgi:hypothetical protein
MVFTGQSTSTDTSALPLLFVIIAACWWALDGALHRQTQLRQWAAAAVTFAALLVTYRDMGTSGPVARYPFQDTLNNIAPLASDRLYLSLYRSPQSNYRADQYEWSFGEAVRPGSTSMFAGVHLINGYSPISPAGVGRLFDFGTHGQINPAKVGEIIIPESGTGGLLRDLGIDGIIVAWDFDLPGRCRGSGKSLNAGQTATSIIAVSGSSTSARGRATTCRPLTCGSSRHTPSRDRGGHACGYFARVELLFSRPFFTGYEARINGAAHPVSAYRGLIPAIEMPAGVSGRVELIYRPRAVLLGGAIAAATAVAMILAGILQYRRGS